MSFCLETYLQQNDDYKILALDKREIIHDKPLTLFQKNEDFVSVCFALQINQLHAQPLCLS